MAVTLASIKQQCRERADMVDSEFIEDAELTGYINNSIAELHDLLIGAYNEDYYMEVVEFAATSDISYPLPNGSNYSSALKFYKIRGVDMRINSDNWQTVRRFNFNRRNEDANQYAWNLIGLPYMEYRLVGSNIRFNRTPDAGTQFRIWYHPPAQALSDNDDSYDDINGWIEYVITDVVLKMKQKQEEDVSIEMAQKQALKQRIESMAQNRDANEPASVTDIYAQDSDITWFGKG